MAATRAGTSTGSSTTGHKRQQQHLYRGDRHGDAFAWALRPLRRIWWYQACCILIRWSQATIRSGTAGLPAAMSVVVGAAEAAAIEILDAARVAVAGLRSETTMVFMGRTWGPARAHTCNPTANTGDTPKRPTSAVLPLQPDLPHQGRVLRQGHPRE